MNPEVEGLYRAIGLAHVKIEALETMLMVFLGSQAKRDPRVANLLRQMASGEVPDLEPDLSVLPHDLSDSQRAQITANLEQQRKASRQYMSQLANKYAEHIKPQN